jgi:hypothetical protein
MVARHTLADSTEWRSLHRGALEYLGETYLAMGRLAEAHATLTRMEIACKRITSDASADGWKSGCEEWQELKAAIDSYHTTAQ